MHLWRHTSLTDENTDKNLYRGYEVQKTKLTTVLELNHNGEKRMKMKSNEANHEKQ